MHAVLKHGRLHVVEHAAVSCRVLRQQYDMMGEAKLSRRTHLRFFLWGSPKSSKPRPMGGGVNMHGLGV